jgi:3'-phosphoadenosine 5'-phosphosulfate sulfotransferase (PAPS reductase)/FAD synthetase
VIEAQTERPITRLEIGALATLDQGIAEYRPQRLYALFSGGYDSLVTTHVTAQHPDFAGVLHIDTTIGLPQTQAYVRRTCAQFGWPLTILRPWLTYAQLIVKVGFPGPALHDMCYQRLKERPLQTFVGTIKVLRGKGLPNKAIGLASGVRNTESTIRMGYKGTARLENNRLWLNPIQDWTAHEVQNYMEHHNLPRSEVKDLLHISGECFCGAFAAQTERHDLQTWYPEFSLELSKYEELVRVARTIKTVQIAAEASTWGWGRGIPLHQAQLFPLCHFCREQAAA